LAVTPKRVRKTNNPFGAELALSFIFIVDQLHDSAIVWKAVAFFDGRITQDAFAITDRFGFNDVLKSDR